VILLVIFLVLQRDPWKRHALKRVHTTGIWCPPGPFPFKDIQAINSSYATQSTRPDKVLLKQQDQSLLSAIDPSDPRTSTTTTEYRYQNCQHPLTSLTNPSAETLGKNDFDDKSLIDNFSLGSDPTIAHDHGRWYRECSASAGHTRRCGATSDLNTPPTKHARRNEDPFHLDINAEGGKDGLLDGTFKNYQHAEVSPPSFGVPQAPLKCPTHGGCSNRTALSSVDPTVDDASEKRNLQRRLRHVLQRQDGLHPLSPNSITLSSNVFQSETHPSHPVGGAEFASRNSQSMEYISPSPGSDNHTLVDRGTGETLLHLAGRYNGGQDIVFSLPHLMCSDDFGERCACVMWLDHHGRTALTNAAAANALETTAALYQLEREALSQNRALLIGQSTDKSHLSAKARRRNKQSELRKSTPLIAAVQAGNEELVRHLVDEGYPIVGVDDFGRNVVHWASVTNAIEILQRLAQCKGFHRLVNARDDYDRTPLMLATREGCEQAVQFLLDHKANVLTMDCTDSDALAIAKSKGFDDIERLLLQRHAEGNEEALRLTDNPHLPFPNVTTPPEPTELSEFSELGTHSTGELEQQSAIFHPDQYSKAPLETTYRLERPRPEDSKSPHLTNYLKFAVPKTTSEFVCKPPGREVTKISPK
ncbi:ankyrin repeat protein, partial [Opisthorchis viverrini]